MEILRILLLLNFKQKKFSITAVVPTSNISSLKRLVRSQEHGLCSGNHTLHAQLNITWGLVLFSPPRVPLQTAGKFSPSFAIFQCGMVMEAVKVEL